jgi:hypothetical protein
MQTDVKLLPFSSVEWMPRIGTDSVRSTARTGVSGYQSTEFGYPLSAQSPPRLHALEYGSHEGLRLVGPCFCTPKTAFRGSIVVSIPACHAGDPGSISGLGAPLCMRSSVKHITSRTHKKHGGILRTDGEDELHPYSNPRLAAAVCAHSCCDGSVGKALYRKSKRSDNLKGPKV